MIEKGCENCYYEYFDEKAYPCSRCIHNKPSKEMWQPKGKQNKRKTERRKESE